jgi:hypothetical protein
VYEIVVHLLNTEQIWPVYRRYSEFVALRSTLKARYHDIDAAERDADRGQLSLPVILAHCKLSRKFRLNRSEHSKERRRQACARFLQLLGEISPVPQEVAEFTELLHGDRVTTTADGTYSIAACCASQLSAHHSLGTSSGEIISQTSSGSGATGYSTDEASDDDSGDEGYERSHHGGGGLGVTATTGSNSPEKLGHHGGSSHAAEGLLLQYVSSILERVIRPGVIRKVRTVCVYVYMCMHIFSGLPSTHRRMILACIRATQS